MTCYDSYVLPGDTMINLTCDVNANPPPFENYQFRNESNVIVGPWKQIKATEIWNYEIVVTSTTQYVRRISQFRNMSEISCGAVSLEKSHCATVRSVLSLRSGLDVSKLHVSCRERGGRIRWNSTPHKKFVSQRK